MAALAKRLVVPLLGDAIVDKIGHSMVKAIPERLEMLGLKASVSIVYTKSSYISLEVNLHSVDLTTLVANMTGSLEKAEGIRNILGMISFPRLDGFINKFLLQLMCGKMMQQLPVQMQSKLQDKLSAEVVIIACSEEEQGPLLISTMQELNQAQSQSHPSSSVGSSSSNTSTIGAEKGEGDAEGSN